MNVWEQKLLEQYFTHMSGKWVVMTQRLVSPESVNQHAYPWPICVAWVFHIMAAGF